MLKRLSHPGAPGKFDLKKKKKGYKGIAVKNTITKYIKSLKRQRRGCLGGSVG